MAVTRASLTCPQARMAPTAPFHVPNAAQLLRPLADGLIEGGLDGVLLGEGVHPRGQKQVQLLQGELVEHLL